MLQFYHGNLPKPKKNLLKVPNQSLNLKNPLNFQKLSKKITKNLGKS